MLKNKILLGIILSILLLVFSIPGFTFYNYTQQSGVDYFVGTGDKSDALEDTIEVREILDAYGNLLGHSQYNTTYPKVDGTTIGTLQIPEAGLKFSNEPVNDDIAAYIAGEMTWQTKAELNIQPLDTALTNISALAYVSPSLIKLTANDTYAVRTLAETKEDLSLNYVENLKVKLDGTQAPTVNNDVDEGYAVGSRWFDITNDKEYVCLDNTDGAAVWTETTGAGGGVSQLSDLTDVGITTPTDKYVLVADGDSWESRAISSDDLSDVTSIGMLDENETVTGIWDFNPGFRLSRAVDANNPPYFFFRRSRDGDPTSNVASGDKLGDIYFSGWNDVSGYHVNATEIRGVVDGTPGTDDMPGRLEFLTTPDGSDTPVLRQEIDNAGNIKMGDGAWTNYVNVSAGGDMTAEGTASIKATDLVITSQAAGDILYFNGTNWIRLAKGTAGQVLTMNAGATAPEWQTP